MPSVAKTQAIISKVYPQIRVSERRGCVRLEGTLDRWEDIVEAGRMAVDRKRWHGVLNDITLKDYEEPPISAPAERDTSLENADVDVLIIGAGVIGCAVARELSKWKLKVLLADKESDVAMHASSRNDGVVHPCIDVKMRSAKMTYGRAGNRMFDGVCKDLGVSFERCGQYVFTDKWWVVAASPIYILKALICKIPNAGYAWGKKLRALEPHVDPKYKVAIKFGSAGIVCPYGLTIAYAENAVANGARLSLNTIVEGMELTGERITRVFTNRGAFRPRVVVNCAGTYSDKVAEMANDRFFTVHPRRGTNLIFDTKERRSNSALGVALSDASKSAHTKGGGVIKTVDGNMLVGPDAHETPDREDVGTYAESIDAVIAKHSKLVPQMKRGQIITYFTGVRAPVYEEDFIVSSGKFTKNIVHAAGIQSPGLTAAPAIALGIERLVLGVLGGKIDKNESFNPKREPIPATRGMDVGERGEYIKKNPDFGEIVCRCEEISKGEIIAALNAPFVVPTVDAVKRRARAGMGRCQGAFCSPNVMKIISETCKIPLDGVTKSGSGSEILCGDIKPAEGKR
ncbi:MAG: NAD(P)/FAD-dependent oxidoreductase [Clostridiales bacterium]|jgi:glycerol-3-phosphate dehydrogenase|nr:NAD(P)/FAD-dependent oxidoreductase [Clostridiales bacterium]